MTKTKHNEIKLSKKQRKYIEEYASYIDELTGGRINYEDAVSRFTNFYKYMLELE